MSKAYQCDICKSFYCNNETTKSKVRNYINEFKLSDSNLYSLYTRYTSYTGYASYTGNIRADICPNCTKRIQDTIDDILRERLENKKK